MSEKSGQATFLVILPYGRKALRFKSPPNLVDVIQPRDGKPIDIPAALKKLLQDPIGSPPLDRLIKKGGKVAIIIPDKTRRCPVKEILAPLLDEVERLSPGEISVVIANALHNSYPLENVDRQLFFKKGTAPIPLKIYNHNAKMGRGAFFPFSRRKIRLNKIVREADIVIAIGTIVPHLMAGFSGGAKSIVPGVADKNTIAVNHFLMLHPKSRLGVIEGNILRKDLERGASLLKNVFIINAIYDNQKKVIGLVAGDMIKAHRQGVRLSREIGEVESKKADIVIAGDSFPETINIYQTLKLIAPAAMMVNPGGVIIIAGECPEGEGELSLFNRLFYWRLLKKYLPKGVSIYLLSEARKTKNFPFFLRPITSIEEGIDMGFKKIGPYASVLILSGAGLLIPRT